MDFEEFNTIYLKQVEKIFTIFNDDLQNKLADHCYGWSADKFDFKNYLYASSIRYFNCYQKFLSNVSPGDNINILDIGGFLCAFPLTLVQLGYRVSITEKLEYYNHGLEKIFDLASSTGIEVIDKDMVSEEIKISTFSHICCFALLEHLPSSPKLLMDNIYNNLATKGSIYIEVPNIAYWNKRWDLFKGNTPLSTIELIYHSKTPFIGHHHEYTIKELRWLINKSKFDISNEIFFNYSIPETFDVYNDLCRKNIPAYLFRECKEIIAIIAKKNLLAI